MEELWKPIEGYEGLYEISSLGRVKKYKNGKYKILKISIDTGGYAYKALRKNGIQKNFLIHRLVAKAFLENKKEYQNQVNHKNNIKTDNVVDNLEWCSAMENYCHRSIYKKRTSKYTGVSLSKRNKWISQICINKRVYHIGCFASEEEAYKARVNFELNNNIKNKYL